MSHVGTSAPTPTNKTTNYSFVFIRWADTHLSESGWLDLDEYEDDGECIVETAGFLVPLGEPGSKEGHVSVWQTLCANEGIHAVHIPVAMVRDLKIIS